MFVLKSTYAELELSFQLLVLKYSGLQDKWNDLVEKINEKGGQEFLENGDIRQLPKIGKADIKKLLLLCHPDKHANLPVAEEMTKKLLELRQQ